jgi:hypothetical protein
MSLFNQAERLEREQFFRRLDYQWGRGLKQKTKSDRCPDFRVVTRPPAMHAYCVQQRQANRQWVTVYSNVWASQCQAWVTAQELLWSDVRLRVQALAPRSNQTSVTKLPRTHVQYESGVYNGVFAPSPVKAPRDQAPNSGLHFARGLFGGLTRQADPIQVEFRPCLCALCKPLVKPVLVDIVPTVPRYWQYQFWGLPVAIW